MNIVSAKFKVCSRCGENKELSEDNWHRKGENKFRTYCRLCTKAYNNKYYANSKKTQASIKARRNSQRKILHETIKHHKDKACLDCKQKFKRCQMDFDHRPGEKKEFDIFRAKQLCVSIETLLKEIAKCDLVCSNCHRLRTAIRDGSVDD